MTEPNITYRQLLKYLNHLTTARMIELKVFDDLDRESLLDAVEILLHVSLNLAWKHHSKKLTTKQMGILSQEFAMNLQQSVMHFTGINTLAQQDEWPETVEEKDDAPRN